LCNLSAKVFGDRRLYDLSPQGHDECKEIQTVEAIMDYLFYYIEAAQSNYYL